MSISGNLEDVSVAEVLQFVHIGRRTGTLVLAGAEGRGEVGFHRGRIISASSPDSQKLGTLLLAKGLLERAQLDEALRLQETQRPRRSLGQILVESGLVDTPDLRKTVAAQIEETVYQLVTWKQGSFEFALDELRPVDDIGVYPGDILPDIHLNTQMLVLEALRIFDEKNRPDELFTSPPGELSSDSEAAGEPVDTENEASLERLEEHQRADPTIDVQAPGEDAAGPPPLRVHLLSDAADLAEVLADPALREVAEVARVELVDAGLTLPGQSSPVVVADLRGGRIGVDDVAGLLRSRPHASVVGVVDDERQAAGAYAAGALAAVPATSQSLIACLRSVVRERREVWATGLGPARRSAAFARLRRVVADLRSGLLSATVALNLMNVISESVERAIMFLVRDRRLVALGAFGHSMSGVPLARLTAQLEMSFDSRSALSEALDDGQTRSLNFDGRRPPAHGTGGGLSGSGQPGGDRGHLYRQRTGKPGDRGDRDPRAGGGAGRSGLRERVAAA